MIAKIVFRVISLCGLFLTPLLHTDKFCFATATDTEHYAWTLNLVASIQRYHERSLEKIAIYDLGLKEEERAHLNSLASVEVYDIERANPAILEKFVVNKKGKIARGWYSWKPVAIKQAMDMFPSFFYLDSGVTVVGPMDCLFEEVNERGYFFIDCGHSIERMTTKPLIEKFKLRDPQNKLVLKQKGISAGIQGLSKRLYDSYVMPIYRLSFDIANFEDDGSCPKGFGWARHDQTLFSIQARLLSFHINEVVRSGTLQLMSCGRHENVHLEHFLEITRENFDPNFAQKYLKYKYTQTK